MQSAAGTDHNQNIGVLELIKLYKNKHSNAQIIPDAEFLTLLSKHMTDWPESEIAFFVNRNRFRLFNALMDEILAPKVRSILNVASGPFAFENYVEMQPGTTICAFDINPCFEGIYNELKKGNIFPNLTYTTQSVETFSDDTQYDLVLINDLFYHKSVNFNDHIQKFLNSVKPGGYIYFDICDLRAKWLWSILGKDARFARFDFAKVEELLIDSGFEIKSITPSLGIGSRFDFIARVLIYGMLRIANNSIFIARKSAK